jgi:hypothetical protein
MEKSLDQTSSEITHFIVALHKWHIYIELVWSSDFSIKFLSEKGPSSPGGEAHALAADIILAYPCITPHDFIDICSWVMVAWDGRKLISDTHHEAT